LPSLRVNASTMSRGVRGKRVNRAARRARRRATVPLVVRVNDGFACVPMPTTPAE